MFDWQIVVIIILGLFSAIAGMKWQQFKAMVKEGAEALTILSSAIADDKVTRKELKQIGKELADVIVAFKKLIGR